MTEHLWRVRVKASWTYSPEDVNVGVVTRKFIVSAKDSSAALQAGEHATMYSAMLGPRWIYFQAVEACLIKLPFELRPHPKLKERTK